MDGTSATGSWRARCSHPDDHAIVEGNGEVVLDRIDAADPGAAHHKVPRRKRVHLCTKCAVAQHVRRVDGAFGVASAGGRVDIAQKGVPRM